MNAFESRAEQVTLKKNGKQYSCVEIFSFSSFCQIRPLNPSGCVITSRSLCIIGREFILMREHTAHYRPRDSRAIRLCRLFIGKCEFMGRTTRFVCAGHKLVICFLGKMKYSTGDLAVTNATTILSTRTCTPVCVYECPAHGVNLNQIRIKLKS